MITLTGRIEHIEKIKDDGICLFEFTTPDGNAKRAKNGNSEAIFGIHEATNRVTIKIIDKDTKKVLKEIPPEKTLDMIAKVWELAGLMVDEKR